ncbi:unnamed protein product [Blumeria hordei]|uniref:Uncharacterized protein n=2 Tax=Blumeria hordei TaxID=2867405 RepID=A0A383UYW8_BLUHO|nr:putative 3-hydroxybutyrate dehydrogenase type 2 [Blumeria hordei DH14]SZF05107.1 unnamed protein product [Blumeria hordei]
MSSDASRRLAAISEQIKPSAEKNGMFENIPNIKEVAPSSLELRVKGKVAIVTGANSSMGIGRASAHQLAQNGARAIYLCDVDNSSLETHKREIASKYPDVEIHVRQFDAADEAAVKSVIDHAIKLYGRLDIFFANAGIVGQLKPFTQISSAEFLHTLNTNLVSVHVAAKYSAPAMMLLSAEKESPSGSIICTASVAGLRANAGPTDYSASKSGVISLAQTIAYQLSGTGIRINALCPGIVETGMTAPLFEAARARGIEKKIGQLNPVGRGAHADEVARVVLFLGSDESSYVNGQAWAVDGGLSSGHPFILGKLPWL